MKSILITIAAGLALSAFGIQVNYDFTRDTVKSEGKLNLPLYKGDVRIGGTDNEKSLALDGKTASGTIIKSEKLHLANGGTIVAKVRFTDKGDGKEFGIILIKNKEWLLARSGKELYFNIHADGKWLPGVKVPLATDHTVMIVLNITADKDLTIYIAGKKMLSQKLNCGTLDKNDELVTIGSGWGDVWLFKGEIFKLSINDTILTETEIKSLTGE